MKEITKGLTILPGGTQLLNENPVVEATMSNPSKGREKEERNETPGPKINPETSDRDKMKSL